MKTKKKDILARRIAAIPAAVRAAFICCFIAGFIIHIFAFTNIIPNSDGLSRVYDTQQMTVSGRWFLHYATAFNGFVQMPAVIGFFSVLFMSCAAGLCVSLLKIKNTVIGALCGVLMIAFPSVAYTYLYMFTASAYFFGILLAVLAVWLCGRYKYGFVAAALPLACAVGTYQAYLAAAVALSVICVILYALEPETRARDTLLHALKYIAALILGMILYALLLALFLWAKDLKLLSYLGMDTALSSLTPAGIIKLIARAYKQFAGYFFIGGDYCSYAGLFLKILNAAAALTAAGSLARLIVVRKTYKAPGKLVVLAALCLLLPLALNFAALLSETTPIMRYALVFTYIAAAALADRATAELPAGVFTLRTLACVCSALIICSSFVTDNLVYTVSAQAHRSTLSFATRLVERVESLDGYKNGMEVAVIGAFPDEVYFSDNEAFAAVEHYSCMSSSLMPLNKHIYYYLNGWLNVRWDEPDESVMKEIAASDDFAAMPLYPDDGSVAVADGRVVVKLAEEYTPKSDFEIAYESRR